jgi:CRISPR system Cascade subunit CasD
MNTLLLNIDSPLQSWASYEGIYEKPTNKEPTKSGILGMICSAEGLLRDKAQARLIELNQLRMGVLVIQEGIPIKDYQIIGNGGLEEKNLYLIKTTPKNRIINKYYLANARFIVGLEYDDRNLLLKISKSLDNPKFHIYFGRKCCVPASRIVLGEGDGIVEKSLEDALKSIGNDRMILEDENGSIRSLDKPISFANGDKQYHFRRVRQECI